MEYSGLVHDFVSPESTVTSLLSSSGHLRSSLLPAQHNTTFRYRDQDYSSASATLDAYIADFERSHQKSRSLTGRLVLPHSLSLDLNRPRVSTLRNRDVLRERLTDRELDFLNLPVSSLHHNSNRDRLSMTTDELLSIPNDGSMPVTHTSAFIQGLLPRSVDSLPCRLSRPTERTVDRFSSFHAGHRLDLHHQPSPGRTPRSSRCRGRPGAAELRPEADISSVSCHRQCAHRGVESGRAEPAWSLHPPRRPTSNQMDLDGSEPASMPDLNYPAWVHRCDLSELPPLSVSDMIHDRAPRPGTPSWVAELDEVEPDQTPAQVDCQQTLRDLRLQFAEQISLFTSEKSHSNSIETLFRDKRIESLIQKADQVLNSLSRSSGGADSPAGPVSPTGCFGEAVSPVDTEQLLLYPPSCCHPVTLKPAAAGEITEALTDRRAVACDLHGNNTCKQPGPVEAMKQMLFRLQRVEEELQRQHASKDRPEIQETHVELSRGGEAAEQQSCAGGPSLQRALHHLSRLKVLVEEPGGKLREDEDKDRDEGRYSSSSAERLSCTQQKHL